MRLTNQSGSRLEHLLELEFVAERGEPASHDAQIKVRANPQSRILAILQSKGQLT
jgi:hypothetical protein